jgi:hypothetical protein
MDRIWSINLSEIPPHSIQITVAVVGAVGLLYCFVGYRIFRFVLGFTGFILAGITAAILAGVLTEGRLLYMGIAGVLGGAAGTFALLFLYKVGVFCLGVLGALLIAYNCLAGRPESWMPFAIAGAGLVGGLIALVLERPIMMLVTAALGAWITVEAAFFLLVDTKVIDTVQRSINETQLTWILVGVWAGLSLLGLLSQYMALRGAGKKQS